MSELCSTANESHEDRVIKRIPVFLSRNAEQFYVLQHPLRSFESIISSTVEAVRVKPKQQKVEMVVSISNDDESSANFDASKAERLTANTNSSASGVALGLPTRRRCEFKQKIVSDDRSPQKALYALCAKVNDAIWLFPANVCMMKPRFDGLQLGTVRFSKRAKQDEVESQPQRGKYEGGGAETSGDKQQNSGEMGELRAVVHRIQQQDDRLEALRKLSFDAFKKRCDQEPFIECRYAEINTDLSGLQSSSESIDNLQSVLSRLTGAANCNVAAAIPPDSMNQIVANSDRYIESLLRRFASNASASADATSTSKSARMSVPELIRTVLIRAKVIPFNKLIEYLRSANSQSRHGPDHGSASTRSSRVKTEPASNVESQFDTNAILKCLTQYAVLVRGNWVVSSTTLYPDGSKSTRTGVDASILRRGRDFVLFWFTRVSSIKRMDVASHVRMPAEDLDDVIAQVARPNRVGKTERGGWKFLYETDRAFIGRYKDTVNQQAGWWNTRFQILCTELKLKESDIDKIRKTLHEYEKVDVDNERRKSGSASPSPAPNRRRRHSSCCSSASSVASGGIRRRRNTSTMSTDDDSDSYAQGAAAASPSRRGRKRRLDAE